MPGVQSGTVLVTGASGFVGSWVAQKYLDAGFTVKATVRSSSKGDYLVNLFKKYGNKFSYVIVKDIATPHAFDEAIKGVDVVAHTASPVDFSTTNPDDHYIPAIQGSIGILESAATSPQVKRVVVTGSGVAMWAPKDFPNTWDESDWNDAAAELVAKVGGAEAGPLVIYNASKTLAEHKIWEYVESKKGQIAFDVSVMNPFFVFGPIIHEVSSPERLNTSIAFFRTMVLDPKAAELPREAVTGTQLGFTDVRDVADAHVLATKVEAAGGERFAITAGAFTWQKFRDAANAAGVKANKGYPGAPAVGDGVLLYGKSEKILGIKYRSLEEVAVATAKNLSEKYPL